VQAPTAQETGAFSCFRKAVMEDESWLTAKEATLLAGVDVQAIYSWVRRGHLAVTWLDHRGRKLRHLEVAKAEMATRAKAGRVLSPAVRRHALGAPDGQIGQSPSSGSMASWDLLRSRRSRRRRRTSAA